uniref:B30.2/SPRY domain-containing protein n=1 Tax=Steinernema glaseri TaxID=37863 RepID=A0A1I7YNG0_9BILA
MDADGVEKRKFLRKGEGLRTRGKVQYPQLRKTTRTPTMEEVPDSGRGTADDPYSPAPVANEQNSSSQSTVSNLVHREEGYWNLARQIEEGEYGRLGTPSSGPSVAISPGSTDVETPVASKKSNSTQLRQISSAAAQLRDMIANLDHADVMTSRKLDLYFAKLRDDLEKDKEKMEEELRQEWKELERRKKLFEQQKKSSSSENFGQSLFLKKENEELKESNIEKVRRISELTVLNTKNQKELHRLREDNERFKKRCSDLSRNNADLSSELAKMRTRLSSANKTIDDQAQELKESLRKATTVRNNRSSSVRRPQPSKNVAPVNRVAPNPSTSSDNERTNSIRSSETAPLPPQQEIVEIQAPELICRILPCGCERYFDNTGAFREWRHKFDATTVSLSEDSKHIELFAPNDVKITFDSTGTVYVLLPDRTGLVLYGDGRYKIGSYLEETIKGKGQFLIGDVEGICCFKYDEDQSLGWTGRDVSVRCSRGWCKVKVGSVLQFNYVVSQVFYVYHTDASKTPLAKTLCFQHEWK